jgi:hypothetical protein
MNIKQLLTDMMREYSVEVSTYSLDLGVLYGLYGMMELPQKNRYLTSVHDLAKLRSFRPAGEDDEYSGLSFRGALTEKLFHAKIWNFYKRKALSAAVISTGNLSKFELDNQINFAAILTGHISDHIKLNQLTHAMNYDLNLDSGKVTISDQALLKTLAPYLKSFTNPNIVICSREIYSKELLKKITQVSHP